MLQTSFPASTKACVSYSTKMWISYCKWKTIPVVETWECTLDSKLFEVISMRVGIRQAIHLQFVSEAHTPTYMYTAFTLLSC